MPEPTKTSRDLWEQIRKAAWQYCKREGISFDEFMERLKKKAKEGKERKADFISHAERSLPEE